MEIVRDDDNEDMPREIPDSELYEDYLKAERQRLEEESEFLFELEDGALEERKKGILIELEELNKEEIFNLDERYKILEKIKNKETTKEKRGEINLELHKITKLKSKSLDRKLALWQQMKDLDPSLLTKEQAKRLEAPMDIFSDEFLAKLKQENEGK